MSLYVFEELGLGAQAPATDHAGVAQLDLAVFLKLVLGQGRPGRAHLVAYVALVTSTGLVRGVLDPRVRLELGTGATHLAAVSARHTETRQRFVLQLGRCVGKLLVGLELRFVRELSPLAQLALLPAGAGVVRSFVVVVTLVQGIVVARGRRTTSFLGLRLLLRPGESTYSSVFSGAAPRGRLMVTGVMSLSDVSVEKKLDGESLSANRASVQAGRVAGQVKLQLQFGIATDPAENAPRPGGGTRNTGCGGGTPRYRAVVRHRGRCVNVSDVAGHFGFASEEAPSLPGRVTGRVLVIGNGASVASIDSALLAVFHREMDLYRYPGVESVPAQSASVEMMSVAVEEMPLE